MPSNGQNDDDTSYLYSPQIFILPCDSFILYYMLMIIM